MKFIDKKGPFPTKLAQWKYYHHKELYGFYINSVVKGSTIWKYLDNHKELDKAGIDTYSKAELRKSLLEDQGYICCYCGKRIENDSRTPIEHLNPKSIYKNRTYDYINLLASCDGESSHKIHFVKIDETLASIASDYGLSEDDLINNYIDVDTSEHIRQLTNLYDIENLKVGDRLFIIPKLNPIFQHCDTKKNRFEIVLQPIQSSIETHFSYLPDGTIDVSGNTTLKNTVDTLGLNLPPLLIAERKGIRAAAIRKKGSLFLACKKDPVLYKKALKNLCQKYYTKDAQGKLEPFVFVIVSTLRG
jgi:uncharacterized protein (TIGR02646 family)